ncbi:MAG: hypothetical protein IPL46_18175 [Saprospiraceae bacterium]|nr:hypothetical protein [Saprospiraceae bacterium]
MISSRRIYALSLVVFLMGISTLISAQHQWTGAVDSVYENPANWNPASTPTLVDDVIIPDGTPHAPVITTVGAQAQTIEIQDSLKISAGAVLTLDEGNGSGRLSGDGMLIADFRDLIVATGGTLVVQNCANVGLASTGTITNYGIIQIMNCVTALYDGGADDFAAVHNFGEIIGSNLATQGISFTMGRFYNRDCAYVSMDEEIRSTTEFTYNHGTMVVTSLDSLVVYDNSIGGILHNSAGGGIRTVLPNAAFILPVAGAIYWVGCIDSSWFNPKNWITHQVPGPTDQVIVAYSVNDLKIVIDTAYAGNILMENSRNLDVLSDGTLCLTNTSADPAISATDNSRFRNFGTVKIDNLTSEGILNTTGQISNEPRGRMYIKGGSVGILNQSGSSSFTNSGLIELENFSGNFAIQNNSTSGFTSQPCGIIDIKTDEGLEDVGNTFFNSGSIILRAGINSDLQTNSGVIHHLGGGSLVVNNNSGTIETNSSAIFWSGCIDTSWHRAVNWSRNEIPIPADSVVIPGRTYDPVIQSATATISHLHIHSLVSLKIKNGGALFLDALPLASSTYFAGSNDGQITIDSGGMFNLTSNILRAFVIDGSLHNAGNIISTKVSLNNDGGLIMNENTIMLTEADLANYQGGMIQNDSFIRVQNGTSYLLNSLSGNFHNYGEIQLIGTLGNGLQNVSDANFTNHACASLITQRGFVIDGGTVTNQGYIDYTSTNYSLIAGSYIDEGFQYDPNTLLPDGSNTVILAASITHAQFTGDYDMNGDTYCSGDLYDLCQFTNATLALTSALDHGNNSLRDVIRNACPGATIISQLNPNDTIKLDSSIIIDKDITIIGVDTAYNTIDGSHGDFSLFQIRNSAQVQFRNIQFINGGGSITTSGGAIETSDGNNPTNLNRLEIINCLFRNNECSNQGGAIENNYCNATINNSIFQNNNGGLYGGAVYAMNGHLVVVNTLIASNQCGNAGGGLAFFASYGELYNSTISSNNSQDVAGGIHLLGNSHVNLYNSIVFDNAILGSSGPDIFNEPGNSFTAVNNLIGDFSDSGVTEGTNNNISGDPLFIDPLSGNFHLDANSPCFNVGDESLIPVDSFDVDGDLDKLEFIDIDLSGAPRNLDNLTDLGAYEQRNDGCTRAFRLYCGQIATGTNTYLGNNTVVLEDCVSNIDFGYMGPVWHRFTGSGDNIRISGFNTGDYAEIQLYSGGCENLICIEGKYDFQSPPSQLADLLTVPGEDYFIMMANYDQYSPVPNIDSYQLDIQCICGDNPLTYDSPNDFDSGESAQLQTDNTITATNIIKSGASIIYDGALGILLNQGFNVEKGGIFIAQTNGCDP